MHQKLERFEMGFLCIVAIVLLLGFAYFRSRRHGSVPAPLDEFYFLGGLRRETTYERLGASAETHLNEADHGCYVIVRAIDGPSKGEVRTVTYKKDVPDIFHLGPWAHVVVGSIPPR